MESDGALGHPHDLSDFPIGFAVLDPVEDRELAHGEPFDTAIHGLCLCWGCA